MTARTFHPALEPLEDRRTPSTVSSNIVIGDSFPVPLGGGHSAVTLLVNVQIPPASIAPETVTLSRLLPNGIIREVPPQPITPPNPNSPPSPVHELFAPGPLRGWLQAAGLDSSAFIVSTTIGDT
jgi:hypothetical protein